MAETLDTLKPLYHRIVDIPESGTRGFVVIDDFVYGRGTGGVRCTADVTLDEVARLAREMTLKFAFLRLPSGGAKAGLVIPSGLPETERKKACFEFGRAISDLVQTRQYVGGLDLGSTAEDLQSIMAGAGVPAGQAQPANSTDSNYFTALTVYVSAQALLESRGKTLRGTTVLVEGVGKVGSHLLRLLDSAGARIVGVSTLLGSIYNASGFNIEEILDAKARRGDAFVHEFETAPAKTAAELFECDADLLIPGANADSIHAGNVSQIKARWIVPVANICADQAIESALHERGIDYVPGFVSNIGGIFCWYLSRLPEPAREEIIRVGFKSKVARAIRIADSTNSSIAATARQISRANLAQMKRLGCGGISARINSVLWNLSPKRLGFVVGSKLLGPEWRHRWHGLSRAYYNSQFFD